MEVRINLLESLLCPSALRSICSNGFISHVSGDFKTILLSCSQGFFLRFFRGRTSCPVALWPYEGLNSYPQTGHLQPILSEPNSRFRAQADIWGQWPDRACTPCRGKEGGLVSLQDETIGAWRVWRRWTSVKVCRRHLISPAWIRREKKCCQMGWNTQHSSLVKTGERKPGASDSKLIGDEGTRGNLFLGIWKPHDWARARCACLAEPACRASLC